MYMLKAMAVGLLAAGMLAAADPSGKWEAVVQTPRGEAKTTFNFKADGDKLTGTVSNPMGKSDIQDGKISGDDISFTQVIERNDRKMTIEWTGKLNGDQLELKRKMAGMDGPRGQRPNAGGDRPEGRGRRGGGPGGPGGPGPNATIIATRAN